MSQLDLELNQLRTRISALEEQKRIEEGKAAEKKAFPLKTLEVIIDEKRQKIERNSYSKSIPLARFYDQEKVDFLEPILNMLKDIQQRLEVLEHLANLG
jgi:predicted nucleic acid-binding protein